MNEYENLTFDQLVRELCSVLQAQGNSVSSELLTFEIALRMYPELISWLHLKVTRALLEQEKKSLIN